ncbi:hypothetical protein JCM19037_3056 [Geomicrobium sp. JCM 19037]|uniref:hypothetical protein n=1 Tax=Geomicrobium sp. JCM 19037 TaxID=1460634 RepID=UPI00045F1EF3|nr:hypothetical protein [Geomicrobium sp. JCM 19037]GAK04621.1 hypothetical protein JCM19037_3056 [Geomicrobium sp. JCM 19037]
MDPLTNVTMTIPKGCDNAPRKKIVIDLIVAFLAKDGDTIRTNVSESAVWINIATSEELRGIDQIVSRLDENDQQLTDVEVSSVITHGKFASIDGVVHYEDGPALYFCEVLTFTNASNKGVVKEMKSYHVLK